MLKNEILTPALETIGEEIGQELGAKMVKDFQDAYPKETSSFFIGRNIIDQILAQPNCVGIRFYNALNEIGQKTFVYVGVNKQNEIIAEYSIVNEDGKIVHLEGIIADRVDNGGKGTTTTTTSWF
jgi:hypothetical protein